jgi:hypothetical protein
MDKIIQLSDKLKNKEKKKEIDKFLIELETLKNYYLQGDINKIIIIAQGETEKCCMSNGIYSKEATKICNDFISNIKDYV